MSTDNQTSMLDELENLLQQQLELAHQGNSAGKQIEVLGRRADCLVEKITQADILESPEFESRRNKLKKSYENLCLAITAQKAETSEKLIQVRKGRNLVETYRSNF